MNLSALLAGPIAHTPPAHAVRSIVLSDKDNEPPKNNPRSKAAGLAIRSRNIEKRIQIQIIAAMGTLGKYAYTSKIAKVARIKQPTVVKRLPVMLEEGKIERLPDGIRDGHFVYGLPDMPKDAHLRPDMREVLRPSGNKRKAKPAPAVVDVGADQVAPRKPSRVGNPCADNELIWAVGRIGVLESAIDSFVRAYGRKNEAEELRKLQEVAK